MDQVHIAITREVKSGMEPPYLRTTAALRRKHGIDCVCAPKTAKAVPAFEVSAN